MRSQTNRPLRPEIEDILVELENPANTHLLSALEKTVRPNEASHVHVRLREIAKRLREASETDLRQAESLATYGERKFE